MNGDAERLIRGLCRAQAYDHDIRAVQVIETHISWLLLTGRYAYKIKKPLDLGFLDFSTLEKRRFYCDEEIRLNRRLAPDLYLGVVPIAGSIEAPRVNGSGPALEYAVRMLEFPLENELERVLERGELDAERLVDLADQLARFHASVPVAGSETGFGAPESILEDALENFEHLGGVRSVAAPHRDLEALRAWTESNFVTAHEAFEHRRCDGFVRECHGDLHLGNMVLRDGHVMVFDCIDFSERLRWIDIMSDIAFLCMDLDSRDRPDLRWAFLNRYLERGGDYEGLAVLDFYLVYRALVRAKVAFIRAEQLGRVDPGDYDQQCLDLLAFAHRVSRRRPCELVITHGLAGAGKTVLSTRLAAEQGMVRIASDVERKRMHGLDLDERTGAGICEGIYSAEATERTYSRLAELAWSVIGTGHSVIVDASFLRRRHRIRFARLGASLGVDFAILDVHAPPDILRQRVAERARRASVSDADLRILEHQEATREALGDEELGVTRQADTHAGVGA